MSLDTMIFKYITYLSICNVFLNISGQEDLKLTEWTAWTCSVSCGTGMAFRLRSCLNISEACAGSKKEIRPGCVKRPCPTGDILPYALRSIVEKELKNTNYNFVVNESMYVELKCNNDARRKFDRFYPRSNIHWIKNGQPLLIDPSRIVFDRGDILIQKLVPADTGLYQCKIEWKEKVFQTLGIYAVSVVSKHFQKHTKISRKFLLRCNNGPLVALYGKMKVSWYHNGKKYSFKNSSYTDKVILFNFTKVTKVKQSYKNDKSLRLNYVKKSDEGVWQCIVKDLTKARFWITNRLNLFVGPEPSLLEKIWHNPMYLWITIAGTIFALSIACALFFYYANRETKVLSDSEKMSIKQYFGVDDDQHEQVYSGAEISDDNPPEFETGQETPSNPSLSEEARDYETENETTQ